MPVRLPPAPIAGRPQALALSSLFYLGRHTVTGLLTTSGSQFQDRTAPYRLFSQNRIPLAEIFSVVGAPSRPVARGRENQAQPRQERSYFLSPSLRNATSGGNERSGASRKGTCPRPGSSSRRALPLGMVAAMRFIPSWKAAGVPASMSSAPP